MNTFAGFCCVFEEKLKRSVSAGCWFLWIAVKEVASATLGVVVDAEVAN